jgi:hypothetical protein
LKISQLRGSSEKQSQNNFRLSENNKNTRGEKVFD